MKIDFHTHIFSSQVKKNRDYYLNDNNFATLYANPKARIIDDDELLTMMDEQEIEYAVAMGFSWETCEYSKQQNEYLFEVKEKSNGRIIPFASLPTDIYFNVADYICELQTAGFAGIGEKSFYHTGLTQATGEYLGIIFSHAARYGLPVCLHLNEPVGHLYPGKYKPSFDVLYALIEKHPDTVLILSHWGGGLLFYELMPRVQKVLKNVYFDTAASPFLYNAAIYRIASDIIGNSKILFGSDYPLISPQRYFKEMYESGITDQLFHNMTSSNAARILHIV